MSWLDGMRHAFRRLFGIFMLALRGMIRLLVDAAPWIVVAGAVYLILLTPLIVWSGFRFPHLTGKVLALPARDDVSFPIQEQLIVELYSK